MDPQSLPGGAPRAAHGGRPRRAGGGRPVGRSRTRPGRAPRPAAGPGPHRAPPLNPPGGGAAVAVRDLRKSYGARRGGAGDLVRDRGRGVLRPAGPERRGQDHDRRGPRGTAARDGRRGGGPRPALGRGRPRDPGAARRVPAADGAVRRSSRWARRCPSSGRSTAKGRDPGEVVREVGLQEKTRARVGTLSGGQKQRLAVACALVGDPELLFLDEPTTGLDPQSRRQVWDIVNGFKERGRTVVLTTHYMDEAERLCDRIAVVDHGRVIARGTPRELIRSLGGDHVIEIAVEEGGAGEPAARGSRRPALGPGGPRGGRSPGPDRDRAPRGDRPAPRAGGLRAASRSRASPPATPASRTCSSRSPGGTSAMSDRARVRAFLALCLARLREGYREPEVLFWAFVFPVLLSGALAVAFRDRPPEPVPGARRAGTGRGEAARRAARGAPRAGGGGGRGGGRGGAPDGTGRRRGVRSGRPRLPGGVPSRPVAARGRRRPGAGGRRPPARGGQAGPAGEPRGRPPRAGRALRRLPRPRPRRDEPHERRDVGGGLRPRGHADQEAAEASPRDPDAGRPTSCSPR